MMEARKAKLINADWPDIGFRCVLPVKSEYLRRIEAAYIKTKEFGLSNLVVCRDKEHFANIILGIKE